MEPTPGATNVIYAIVLKEGYGTPGKIPTWANNPGDISEKRKPGVTYANTIYYTNDNGEKVDTGLGVKIYPDIDTGKNALVNYINNVVAGKNSNYPKGANTPLGEFYTKYVGGTRGFSSESCGRE